MGSVPLDLEALRDIFSDKRSHVVVGKVIELELASDKSMVLARCSVLTQDREVIAQVAWDACSSGAGSFFLPQVGDLVILEFGEGSSEQCFLTKRISSKSDPIPTQALTGDMVQKALTGKKLHLLSDLKILLGKGASDPTQPLVLGNVLLEMLTTLYDLILNAPQVGFSPFGPVFLDPTIRAQMILQKQQYLTDATTNIVSQLSFTERGGS